MVHEELWEADGDMPHRVILRATLREASLTPWPAYPGATAEPRAASIELKPRLADGEPLTEARRRLGDRQFAHQRELLHLRRGRR